MTSKMIFCSDIIVDRSFSVKSYLEKGSLLLFLLLNPSTHNSSFHNHLHKLSLSIQRNPHIPEIKEKPNILASFPKESKIYEYFF